MGQEDVTLDPIEASSSWVERPTLGLRTIWDRLHYQVSVTAVGATHTALPEELSPMSS